jgi:hypothetical protein
MAPSGCDMVREKMGKIGRLTSELSAELGREPRRGRS